jgi:hypothetical protein
MTDREEQLERLREAVDRKSEQADAAARSTHHSPAEPAPGATGVAGDQRPLEETGRPQDVFSVRDKNAGKGKKTADKWNQ